MLFETMPGVQELRRLTRETAGMNIEPLLELWKQRCQHTSASGVSSKVLETLLNVVYKLMYTPGLLPDLARVESKEQYRAALQQQADETASKFEEPELSVIGMWVFNTLQGIMAREPDMPDLQQAVQQALQPHRQADGTHMQLLSSYEENDIILGDQAAGAWVCWALQTAIKTAFEVAMEN